MEKRVQGSLTWEFSEVQVALTGFKKLRLNRQHLHRHQTIVAVRAVGGCVELVSMCCLWKRSASDSASFSYHRLDLVWKTLEVAVRFLWKRWGAHWGKQVLNRDVPSAGQTNPPSHRSLADRCCLLGFCPPAPAQSSTSSPFFFFFDTSVRLILCLSFPWLPLTRCLFFTAVSTTI